MTTIHPALLPSGLKDLLPPEAEEEVRVINQLMSVFAAFGFRRVKPPLVEFEDSLLAPGPGQVLAPKIFRLMDPVSQRMMGVRADTTAQIARLASSSLAQEERPLRLSYAADILRVNGSQLRPERQFCQVGCELIGADNVQDDVEISLLAVKALHDCGIKGLSIDLSIPRLVDVVFESFAVESDERMKFESAIQKRERDDLAANGSDIAACLVHLLDCSGIADQAIENLRKAKLPDAVQAQLDNLFAVYDGLVSALKIYGLNDVQITIDLIERRGFEYKNGVSFTLFSPHVRGELGRGGRYNIAEQGENATGFSLYMDSVIQAATIDDHAKCILVDNNEDWQAIQKLQQEGWQVSRGGRVDRHTHEYKNGKIQEIK